MDTVLAELRVLQDPAYRAFHSRLVPTVDPERIIGVRTPALRHRTPTTRRTTCMAS